MHYCGGKWVMVSLGRLGQSVMLLGNVLVKVFCKPISTPHPWLPPGISGADRSALGSIYIEQSMQIQAIFLMKRCLFLIILHSWSLQTARFNVTCFLKNRF